MYNGENFWGDRSARERGSAADDPATDETGERRPLRARIRAFARAAFREPLTHFLIFGVLIFVVAHLIEERSKRYTIAVAPEDVVRIVNSYVQQYGSEPQPSQVQVMVDNYIREEVFLREGLALGLDRNDEIVRRRIAQKYSFLQADMAVPRQPSDSDLQAWFVAHQRQFTVPPRRSFEHRYFAIDERGEAAARRLAEQAEAALASGRPAPAGDAFPGPQNVARLASEDVERLFGGGAEFAGAVFAAAPGTWAGPFRSGFGWHVLRVTEAVPAQPRTFDEAKADALAAWQDGDRIARNEEAYRHLLARYSVTRADQP